MQLDNRDEAQYCFEKVLEINPDNDWVRNDLMGQLKEKKMTLNKGQPAFALRATARLTPPSCQAIALCDG